MMEQRRGENQLRFQSEAISLNGVLFTGIGCEHNVDALVKNYKGILSTIDDSHLVFVEYFPPELEHNVFSNKVFGSSVRKNGDGAGINPFFNAVISMAEYCDTRVGVADIANSYLYEAYYAGTRAALLLGSKVVDDNPLLGFAAFSYATVVCGQQLLGKGMFGYGFRDYERFMADMEDARRLLTAHGILQESRRMLPGSKISYIAPPVHTDKVSWYLKHPNDIPSKLKKAAYKLFPGLDKSVRLYKYSEDNGWDLYSNEKIK